MTGSPPGPAHPAGTPGPDEHTTKPVLTVRNRPHPTVSAAHIMRRPRRQPQGPPAATRSVSARALTPTPTSTCAPRSKTAQI